MPGDTVIDGNNGLVWSPNVGGTNESAGGTDEFVGDPVFDAAITQFGRSYVDEVVLRSARRMTIVAGSDSEVGNKQSVMHAAIFNAREELRSELRGRGIVIPGGPNDQSVSVQPVSEEPVFGQYPRGNDLTGDRVFGEAIGQFGWEYVKSVLNWYEGQEPKDVRYAVRVESGPNGDLWPKGTAARVRDNAREYLRSGMGLAPDPEFSEPVSSAPQSVFFSESPIDLFRNNLAPEWKSRFDQYVDYYSEDPFSRIPERLLGDVHGRVYPKEAARVAAAQIIVGERINGGLPLADYPVPGLAGMLAGAGIVFSSSDLLAASRIAATLADEPAPIMTDSSENFSGDQLRAGHAMRIDEYSVEISKRFAGNDMVLRDINFMVGKLSTMSPDFAKLDSSVKVAVARDMVYRLHAGYYDKNSNGQVPESKTISHQDVSGEKALLPEALRANGLDIANFPGLDRDITITYGRGAFDDVGKLATRRAAVMKHLEQVISKRNSVLIPSFNDPRGVAIYNALADDIIAKYDGMSLESRERIPPSELMVGDIPSTYIGFRVADFMNIYAITTGKSLSFAEREANRSKAERVVKLTLEYQPNQNYTTDQIDEFARRFGSVAAAAPELVAGFIENARLTDAGLRYIASLPGNVEPSSQSTSMVEKLMLVREFRHSAVSRPIRATLADAANMSAVSRPNEDVRPELSSFGTVRRGAEDLVESSKRSGEGRPLTAGESEEPGRIGERSRDRSRGVEYKTFRVR
jgi:hypothetical protein